MSSPTATPTRTASNLLDMADGGIPPALATVVAKAHAVERAERELVDAILAAKKPTGPHTVDQILDALRTAGVEISRATLYNRISAGK